MPATGCAFALCVHADVLDAAAADQVRGFGKLNVDERLLMKSSPAQTDATVEMQCGAATVLVPLRTAAAVSLFRASKLDSECNVNAALSIGRMSELHAQAREPANASDACKWHADARTA